MRRWAKYLIFSLLAVSAWADQPPTFEILDRVVYIKVGNETGSAFTIEHNEKQVLVTARHMVVTLPRKKAKINVFLDGHWTQLTGNILLPDDKDVDIAVFTLDHDITSRLAIEIGGTVAIGQQGFFLGFPHGWHTELQNKYIAFVKRASLSAITKTPKGSEMWYLDGFNNPGFSGGPVIFYNTQTGKWMVQAVVSGFMSENAHKFIGGAWQDSDTFVNSGVIAVYPIAPVKKILEKLDSK